MGISTSSSVLLHVCLGPSPPLSFSLATKAPTKTTFPDVSFRFSHPQQQQQHFHHFGSGQETSGGIVINHGRAVPNEHPPSLPPSTQSQYWNSGGGSSNPSAHTDFSKKQIPPPPLPHAITNFSSNSNLNQARDSKILSSH